MRRLVFLASARRDLADILEYVTRESGSLAVGRGFAGRLRRQCEKLASLPGTLGRARPELSAGIRSSSFKGYLIFFRYAEDSLEIVNVIEGHRDLARLFDDSDEPDQS